MAAENIANRVNDKFPNLESVVAQSMWPTPQASDNRDRGSMRDPAIQRRIKLGKQVGLSMAVKDGANQETGSLNPQWVSWLMGFPQDWNEID
tara:strand:+ start:206 stop:481 length:276 start_codon:yes stop_codon:yes gene_type:complete